MALAFFVGAAAGVLSGCGVGGGTLLLIYLTAFAGVGQVQAQGVNLAYFLPCSAAALYSHLKNKQVEREAFIPAAVAGCLCTLPAAWLATALNGTVLRRLFGVFLIVVGLREMFRK